MNFKLIPTAEKEDTEEEASTEGETYEDIQQGKTQPIRSSVDKKRDNKTIECPNCKRRMNKKTYKYSHKCPTSKTETIVEAKEEPQQEPPPPQPSIQEIIMKQREEKMQQRQDKIDRLFTNAF